MSETEGKVEGAERERTESGLLENGSLTLLETVLATLLGELEGKAGTRSQTTFASLLAGFPEMTEAGLIE